ncbi:MAG: aminomethyl-transferring glycine dehydrogenase subunit GcvPB [Lachnospiraceae bacterium]|nr:aminomethyl-transferring glycine dehydrogenase subunit GcvPB [Lachnospiraceae bacterium]
MKLIFERSVSGRGTRYLPDCDVPVTELDSRFLREKAPALPEISENDLCRHYTELEKRAYGVNDGPYPLGSCTMKYNPKVNEAMAALPGFADVHPLQPAHTAAGCLEVLTQTAKYLCEITGMDAMTLTPAAGAHGELTGMMLIRRYHEQRGEKDVRRKVIVPDSSHGTNPATAAMNGLEVVSIPSTPEGLVDLAALAAAVGPDTAGLMLTNPNTLGLFDPHVEEITRIVHEAGGLCYYDGANLNPIMGVVRPGDMGFDCVHLNLHKTFSTPHGGGGPGAGAVGCKAFLAPYLPAPFSAADPEAPEIPAESIGAVKAFAGNFLVIVRALTYLKTLGAAGVRESAQGAVLNANYLKALLADTYEMAQPGYCMHEFVMTLEREKQEKGFTAMEIAKGLLDEGVHPPTMYFPLIVHEALMAEPTETESPESIEALAEAFLRVYRAAEADPEGAHHWPKSTVIGRPDEVEAARHPVVRYVPAQEGTQEA